MSERFSDAQAGDKVYDRIYGHGFVSKVCAHNSPQFSISFDCGAYRDFTLEGKESTGRNWPVEPTLFYVDGDNKYATERPKLRVPWDKVPVDTKIILNGVCRRYYAGGRRFFLNGVTSWTSDINNASGDACNMYMALAEEITIDGVTYPVGAD